MRVISRKLVIGGVLLLLLAAASIVVYRGVFGAVDPNAAAERFVVPLGTEAAAVPGRLAEAGFVRRAWALRIALSLERVGALLPGGYELSKSMSVWAIAKVLGAGPYMKWVVIPEGLRKEEIASILARELGWSNEARKRWIEVDTAMRADYVEGVYFPDTYLIALAEPPAAVANRMRARFEEAFAPFAAEARKQNIRWTTLVKVASLVQREAASRDDMPIIAGVIWNRLLDGMRLQVDATVQYARDTAAALRQIQDQSTSSIRWWVPPSPADREMDSPYNTYRREGLPPRPIANPGAEAIRAVLHPAATKCLFYLHDADRQIHCAATFEEHKMNIEKYLK